MSLAALVRGVSGALHQHAHRKQVSRMIIHKHRRATQPTGQQLLQRLPNDHRRSWPHARNRDTRQRRAIEDALAADHSVVVDNTNASPHHRAPLIAIAQVRSAGVRAVYLDVPGDGVPGT